MTLYPAALASPRRLKVYTASKLKEALLWRSIALEWVEIEFVARWVTDHVTEDGEPGWPETCPAHGALFWLQDHQDVARADLLLVYGQGEDALKGALVEVGMALALGKRVVVVGQCPSYGTWQYHSGVARVSDFAAARTYLRLFAQVHIGAPQ